MSDAIDAFDSAHLKLKQVRAIATLITTNSQNLCPSAAACAAELIEDLVDEANVGLRKLWDTRFER